MDQLIWHKYRCALRRGRPDFYVWDPKTPNHRLDNILVGQPARGAFREIRVLVEIREPLESELLTLLLMNIRQVETLDNPFFTPPLHLCFWRADRPDFFRQNSMSFDYQTNTVSLAKFIIKEAGRINEECAASNASNNVKGLLMPRALKRINNRILTVVVAAQSIEIIRYWINPYIRDLNLANLSLVAIQPERFELSVGDNLFVNNRHGIDENIFVGRK